MGEVIGLVHIAHAARGKGKEGEEKASPSHLPGEHQGERKKKREGGEENRSE